MNLQELKNIVEAALLAADRPLNITALQKLFGEEAPDKEALRKVLEALGEDYVDRGIELKEVGSGFRIQVKQALAPWISKMYEEKPTKYSRALLETIALIAYRQPITRAGIEDIRGVSVSSNIIKTLLEREWVRVVGHRDVPGKPALYGTTRQFLDYFNLKNLGDLPPLAEMRSIETIQQEFDLKLHEAGLGHGDGHAGQDAEAGSEDEAESETAIAATASLAEDHQDMTSDPEQQAGQEAINEAEDDADQQDVQDSRDTGQEGTDHEHDVQQDEEALTTVESVIQANDAEEIVEDVVSGEPAPETEQDTQQEPVAV